MSEELQPVDAAVEPELQESHLEEVAVEEKPQSDEPVRYAPTGLVHYEEPEN